MVLAHNYLKKLMQLEAEGKLPVNEPGLWHVDIEHDGWCGTNSGSCCNCDPDIYIRPDDGHVPRRKLA